LPKGDVSYDPSVLPSGRLLLLSAHGLFSSNDSGLNWEFFRSDSNLLGTEMAFFDDRSGFFWSGQGRFGMTRDGGKTVELKNADFNPYEIVGSLVPVGSEAALVLQSHMGPTHEMEDGGAGGPTSATLLRSDDGGQKWRTVFRCEDKRVHSDSCLLQELSAYGDRDIWIVGNNSVFVSSDAGEKWKACRLTLNKNPRKRQELESNCKQVAGGASLNR